MKPDLRARQKLIGIFQAQIGKDVPGPLFKLNRFSSFSYSCANSCASAYRFLIKSTSRFGVSMPFFDFF